MTKYLLLLGAFALFSLPPGVHAGDMTVAAPGGPANRSGETGQAEGSVVGIDIERGRVTLKHGAIDGLGMPAMTMVFRVADPSMLAHLKAGDAVRFTVVRVDNFFTVTQLTRR